MATTKGNPSNSIIAPIAGISSIVLPFPLNSAIIGGMNAASAPKNKRLHTGLYSGGGHALGYIGGGLSGGALGYAIGRMLSKYKPELQGYAPEQYGALLGAILGSTAGGYIGARKGKELATGY